MVLDGLHDLRRRSRPKTQKCLGRGNAHLPAHIFQVGIEHGPQVAEIDLLDLELPIGQRFQRQHSGKAVGRFGRVEPLRTGRRAHGGQCLRRGARDVDRRCIKQRADFRGTHRGVVANLEDLFQGADLLALIAGQGDMGEFPEGGRDFRVGRLRRLIALHGSGQRPIQIGMKLPQGVRC